MTSRHARRAARERIKEQERQLLDEREAIRRSAIDRGLDERVPGGRWCLRYELATLRYLREHRDANVLQIQQHLMQACGGASLPADVNDVGVQREFPTANIENVIFNIVPRLKRGEMKITGMDFAW